MTDDRGSRNGVGQMARPVVVPWTCHRSGECCRTPKEISVSNAERAILDTHKDRASRPLIWIHGKDGDGFLRLETGPCPFLGDDNACQVYDVRPYNCRRFMCGRVDVTKESYEEGGPMGCHNLSDRIETSLRFQEFYAANERRQAKEWALEHGYARRETAMTRVAQQLGTEVKEVMKR